MAPLIVLLVSFTLLLGTGRIGAGPTTDPLVALRASLALMFATTALAHFDRRRADLARMVPPALGHQERWVTATGVLEGVGALALLVPALARPAAVGLAAMLVAMFPANVRAARQGLAIGGRAVTPLVPRTLIQVVFLAALALVAGLSR